jgi:hypothetical protein
MIHKEHKEEGTYHEGMKFKSINIRTLRVLPAFVVINCLVE